MHSSNKKNDPREQTVLKEHISKVTGWACQEAVADHHENEVTIVWGGREALTKVTVLTHNRMDSRLA